MLRLFKGYCFPIGFLINRLGVSQGLTRVFRLFLAKILNHMEGSDNFWTILNYPNKNRLLHRLIHYMNDRTQYADRWRSALVDTKIPCLLINGNQDPVSGKHLVEAYREITKKNDIVEFPQLGHYPQWESAEAVNQAIEDWLRRGL